MRGTRAPAVAAAAVILVAGAADVQAQDSSRAAAGGIQVAGWAGKVDAREASAGQTVDSARFVAGASVFQ